MVFDVMRYWRTRPHSTPEGIDPEHNKTLFGSTIAEAFSIVTLVKPTLDILNLWKPFLRFRTNHGGSVHYMFAALVAFSAAEDLQSRHEDGEIYFAHVFERLRPLFPGIGHGVTGATMSSWLAILAIFVMSFTISWTPLKTSGRRSCTQ